MVKTRGNSGFLRRLLVQLLQILLQVWFRRVISGEVAVGTALADRLLPLQTATGCRVFVTGVSHACLSSDFPPTKSKNARWIFSVTGPRAPLPTVIRSTE